MDERFCWTGREQQGSSNPRRSNTMLGLAHDFCNMLQLATSAARVVRREMRSRSEQKLAAMLDDALDALERANLLAQRLSGPDANACEREDVRLQELVPELRSLISQALGGNIEFESLVAEDLPPVCCDRLQLENVLLNLALNARQAMPDGGHLVIQAVACAQPGHEDCITLSVTDTGHGMPRDVAEKAFQPFFSTRLLDGGNGLGLYNVQAFAEALGGSVQLHSREKQGTRVRLHLPTSPVGASWCHSYPDRFE